MGSVLIYLIHNTVNIIMADAAPAKKAAKAKKPAAKPAHPPFAVMIAAAITALKERGGSSRKAILKYIVANNKVADAAKAQVRVKLAAKKLVPVKGSFKLAKVEEVKKPKKVKKVVKKKAKKPKKAKKVVKKKVAKKPAAKKAAKKPMYSA